MSMVRSVDGPLQSNVGDQAKVSFVRWTVLKAAATASLLANDAKYKKFAQQVDKSLQAFESVNEWADFISFLSRLLKVNHEA